MNRDIFRVCIFLAFICCNALVCNAAELKAITYSGMQVPGLAPGVTFGNFDRSSKSLNISKKGVFGIGYSTSLSPTDVSFIYYKKGDGLTVVQTGYNDDYGRNFGYELYGDKVAYLQSGNLFSGKPGSFISLGQVNQPAPGFPGTINLFAEVGYQSGSLSTYESANNSLRYRNVNSTTAAPINVLARAGNVLTDSVNGAITTNNATIELAGLIAPTSYFATSAGNQNWYVNGSNVYGDSSRPIWLDQSTCFGSEHELKRHNAPASISECWEYPANNYDAEL